MVKDKRITIKKVSDILNHGEKGKDYFPVEENEDFSNFDERFCVNGGAYGFWDIVYYIPKFKVFVRRYYTTSDFDYCPVCGNFYTPGNRCFGCRDKCPHPCTPWEEAPKEWKEAVPPELRREEAE